MKMGSSVMDLRGRDFAELNLPVLNRLKDGDKRLKIIRKKAGKIVERLNTSEEQAEKMLHKYAKKFDGTISGDFKIPPSELEAAADRINPQLLEALKLAEARIREHYRNDAGNNTVENNIVEPSQKNISQKSGGLNIKSRVVPVGSCAVYVPGGGAKYPSSLLMNAIPAQEAGVKKVVVCTPPLKNGSINSNKPTEGKPTEGRVPDEILAAAWLAGVEDVYAVGGAQAIAALAFGTTSIPKVDVICGPGSDYVAQAMKLVASLGVVRVPPSYAGPSEIGILLEKSGINGAEDMKNLALDILAQLEHGPQSLGWVITWEEGAYEELLKSLSADYQIPTGLYGILVEDSARALELMNLSAPEHLQIVSGEAESLADGIKNAGAVFCGVPTALGDFMAGPSHTLPTGGSARFSGALSCRDFQKTLNIISRSIISGSSGDPYADLCESASVIAAAEGFKMHAESLKARSRK